MSEWLQSGKSWLYTHILASDSRPSPRSQSAVCLLHVQSACTNLNSVTWSQAPSLISEAWDILKLKCESWSLADSCQAYNSNWSHCWGDGGGWNCRETINRFTVKDLYGGCMVTASWAALVESLVWVLAQPVGLSTQVWHVLQVLVWCLVSSEGWANEWMCGLSIGLDKVSLRRWDRCHHPHDPTVHRASLGE